MVKLDYLAQPYKVGSKQSNSLAIVIPSSIRKKNRIDSSTIFLVRSTEFGIILRRINLDDEKIPANQSLETGDKQVSIAKGED